MKTNPFYLGKEVSGDFFYDRERAAEDLYRYVTGGISTVIYAPRRYGKTSLVKRVAARAEVEAGMRVVYLDLMKVESVEKFCSLYAREVLKHLGPIEKALNGLTTILGGLRPTISMDQTGKLDIGLDFAGSSMAMSDLEDVLNLPARLATEKKPILVVLDEFQEIATFSDTMPLEGCFRSVMQTHKHVSYVYLGSRTHLMQRMFLDRSRPFYKSASLMHLGKPEAEDSSRYVTSRMKAYGLHIEKPLADQLVAIAESVPYYVQTLAFHVFEATVRRKANRVSADDLSNGVDVLLEMNRDLYETYLTNLSQAQRKLLSALARESAGRFDTAYRTRHSLGVSSTVHSSLVRLQENGLVEQSEGVYLIGDPIFKRYLLG